MQMSEILSETVEPRMLEKFEQVYNEHLRINKVTPKVQFEYAWCLVRSQYAADIYKGLVLLRELYDKDEERRRDYIYYLAVGNARLKQYSKALEYCAKFLHIEPGNQQVLKLESIIRKKQGKGIVDKAIVGLVGIAVGAMLALQLKRSLLKMI